MGVKYIIRVKEKDAPVTLVATSAKNRERENDQVRLVSLEIIVDLFNIRASKALLLTRVLPNPARMKFDLDDETVLKLSAVGSAALGLHALATPAEAQVRLQESLTWEILKFVMMLANLGRLGHSRRLPSACFSAEHVLD
jgi:hypothetical protein